METILGLIISYVMGLAVNEHSADISKRREGKIKEKLERDESFRKTLMSVRSLREELKVACVALARDIHRQGVTEQERPLWSLLSQENFQNNLAEWLMAGGIEEGRAAKAGLLDAMESVLLSQGVGAERIDFLRNTYLELAEKMLLSNPVLASWRHQMSLEYLRDQVHSLRKHAEEAAGIYSVNRQEASLGNYCDKALEAWDIIDLSNLPEGDVHMATQQLLLRQLYMPLRIEVEAGRPDDGEDLFLSTVEEVRALRRNIEAGHRVVGGDEYLLQGKSRISLGEYLSISKRLVVLGDPGGGKTTLLRWMATAYLLRLKNESGLDQFPDIDTLPEFSFIPVLIRCRDLGRDDLCRSFKDFLAQHLYKSKLLPEDADVMLAIILDRLAKGRVILLIDGLDEITDPHTRMIFCQELEHTAARYPEAPIIVTSRIVGYRDMPYRMQSGFEHGVIAELDSGDKDLFARRWVDVTEQKQSEEEKQARVEEILAALHSSDRIERLTGNPMLLTTLALVKRKVGKLPSKRTKLYAEAVSVLLNWNPRLYQAIEEDEAIPQLEYLAFEMCRQGVQRLTEEEVLDLLDRLRAEYPNIRAVRRRGAEEFLEHLEARSSILIKSGGGWHKNGGRVDPVWEFRHLTFQEYLAARALIDGRLPGRDKSMSLADQVAPLAGALDSSSEESRIADPDKKPDVPESWREALRLLVADCKDDDVDEVVLAILNPLVGEDAVKTARPRAVLAALCLADEPNVAEQTAQSVIDALIGIVESGDGNGRTTLDNAVVELGASLWGATLERALVQSYRTCSASERVDFGALIAILVSSYGGRKLHSKEEICSQFAERLGFADVPERLKAALELMQLAYEESAVASSELIERLFQMVHRGGVERHAAVWALVWLSGGWVTEHVFVWKPSEDEISVLIETLKDVCSEDESIVRFLISILKENKSKRVYEAIRSQSEHVSEGVRRDVIGALSEFDGYDDFVYLARLKLGDESDDVRTACVVALSHKGGDEDAGLIAQLPEAGVQFSSAAIRALGRLGGENAFSGLLKYSRSENATIRFFAIRALGEHGELAVDRLIEVLNDEDFAVRHSAIEALGGIGDRRAVGPLILRLGMTSTIEIVSIVGALGLIGDEEVAPSVIELLAHLVDEVRSAAAIALGRLNTNLGIDSLILLLDDESLSVRVSAACALRALGVAVGEQAFVDFLRDENSSSLRSMAVGELVNFRNSHQEKNLLSRDFDGTSPWLDPAVPISNERIKSAAQVLEQSVDEVRALYVAFAKDYNLIIE